MPGIDGLRAIAVAAVFVYHANGGWLPGGFLGVDVFFVISGYLITSLLLAEHRSTGRVELGRFWAGRARRLLPALFLLLAVCLLVGATLDRGRFVELRGDALSSVFYVSNWRFIFEHESYFAQFGRPPLLRHLWSLAVEEQFYLLWPPLFVLAARLRRRAVMPVLVTVAAIGSTALMWALYAPGGDTSRVFYGTDTRAAPLLVGVLLAFVWRPGSMTRLSRAGTRVLDAITAVGLAAVVYLFITVHDYDSFTYRGGFLVLAACTAPLLAGIVHPQGSLGRLLGTTVPRWLGERSYGIYLWHWPVLCLSRPGADVHLARGLLVPLQAAVTIAIAALSYRFVERPIRTGGLQRITLRLPALLREPRTPFAVTGVALAALLALVALTPQSAPALPPGITKQALLASERAAHHLVLQAHHRHRHPAHHRTTRSSSTTTTTPTRTTHRRSTTTTHTRTTHAHSHTRTTIHHHRHHRSHHVLAPTIPHSGPILAVGDSVMLGAAPALDSALGRNLRIDAVVSRQATTTIDRLAEYRAAGSLPQRVIVHIGDNGPVYYADIQHLKAVLRGVPLVVIVNVRVDTSWQSEVDDELRYAVRGWHEATIADWLDASTNPALLADGTHTTPDGAKIFAAVIKRAMTHPHLGGVTRLPSPATSG
jgi:peptidoglycan/LPS O-acetylase OafA/YrhL